MNQGKLEVVKQEMANGKSSISELKLTGVGKFNLDDYYIYYSGQQYYMNQEIPDIQDGFRKGRGTRDQIANIHWITEEAR